MQSEDLVSDNSSPTDKNQGEGVKTVSSNDQSTADNFRTAKESTPTVSTSTPNVGQTRSFFSQLDEHTMFGATSAQVSSQNDIRAPLSNNEPETPPTDPFKEQLKIFSSYVQHFGQVIESLGQSACRFEQFLERLDQLIPPHHPQNESQLREQPMMSPYATGTPSAGNRARSMSHQESSPRNTHELPPTTEESKPVSSIFKKFGAFTGCLSLACSSAVSPESPTSYFPDEKKVVSIPRISEEPTLTSAIENATPQPTTGRIFVCERYHSVGECEYHLCYFDDHSGNFYNFERRVSFPLTSHEVPQRVLRPLGDASHKAAAAADTDENVFHESWFQISQQQLLFLRRNTIMICDADTGTGSERGNLSTVQPAEELDSIAEEGRTLPNFSLAEDEDILLSNDNLPVMERLRNTLVSLISSKTVATVTSAISNHLQNTSTSSEQKKDAVPQEQHRYFRKKTPYTPPGEARGESVDYESDDLIVETASEGNLKSENSQISSQQPQTRSLPSLLDLISQVEHRYLRLRRQAQTNPPEALSSSDHPPSSNNMPVTECQKSIGSGALILLKTGTIMVSNTCLEMTATMTSSTQTRSTTCGEEQKMAQADMSDQSVVSTGLPPADGSGTEVIGEPQGHMVLGQPDQRPTDDTTTAPLFESEVGHLETPQPAGEVISDEQQMIHEESTPASDISAPITESTSSVPLALEGDVDEPRRQNADDSD